MAEKMFLDTIFHHCSLHFSIYKQCANLYKISKGSATLHNMSIAVMNIFCIQNIDTYVS